MTKVIKGEFKKNMKLEDVSLTFDTQLKTFNNEVSRLNGMDDNSKHEVDDDMGYDPFDVPFIEWLGSKKFNYKTMDHYTMKVLWNYWIRGDDEAFKEFNYRLQIDPDLLTKDIEGFKTYEDYKNNWIYEWNKDIPWVDEKPWTNAGALEDSELKDEALRNKTIMEGFVNEDDDESRYEQKRQWNVYTNYDDAYEMNHDDKEREELCEVRKLPVCNVRRYIMIKNSFNNDAEYVAVKENEYDDLTITRKEACQAYQEIFRIIDEG
nr:hypothetical protein [Tanacetum cinerariifolium]